MADGRSDVERDIVAETEINAKVIRKWLRVHSNNDFNILILLVIDKRILLSYP